MRWLPFFILAYLFIGLQIGLGGFVRYEGAGPNLVLLAAVFITINAPREPALLGCFILGALQDLVTQQPLGLYALSYGLVGLVVGATQQVVYREHPLTHLVMALLGGAMTAMVLLAHGWIHAPGAARAIDESAVLPAVRIGAGTLFLTALYTALLAPIVVGVLQRTKRIFGFEGTRSAGFK